MLQFLVYIICIKSLLLKAEECEYDIIIPPLLSDSIKMAKKCTILNGKIIISYISTNYCDIQFPLLREVTKYILIAFSSCGTRGLDILPNLAVVRGIELIHGYSIVVYNTGWRFLNFPQLRVNLGGDIMITSNPYLCNTATVDWNYLNDNFYKGTNKSQVSRKINVKSNRFICSNNCSPSCPQTVLDGLKTRLCWSKNICQSVCSSNCTESGLYCHITKYSLCCHKECLGGCYGTSDRECISCRNFFFNGSCVPTCPVKYYEYNNRNCVSYEKCLAMNFSIIALENKCVLTCPHGHFMSRLNGSRMTYCVNSTTNEWVTKRRCGVLFLKSQKDIDQVTNCYIAERVIIRLQVGGRDLIDKLKEAFKDLEVVTNFVHVMRSNHLESLSFLKPLIYIGGLSGPGNTSATLDISANNALGLLWEPNQKFSIGNGSVRILANRNLCKKYILRFIETMTLSSSQYDRELIESTNGDVAICTVVNLQVSLNEIRSKYIRLNWFAPPSNISYQILSGLAYYRPMNDGSGRITANSMRSANTGCSSNMWTIVEADCGDRHSVQKLKSSSLWPINERTEFICTVSSLVPATTYQIYLEFRFTSQNAAAISNRVFAKTSTEMPSPPQMFEGASLTPKQLRLTWSPPFLPNGDIVKYVIKYRSSHDTEYLHQDYCNSNIDSGFSYSKAYNTKTGISTDKTKTETACFNCNMCQQSCFRSPEQEDELLERSKFENHILSLIFFQRNVDQKNGIPINSKTSDRFGNYNSTERQVETLISPISFNASKIKMSKPVSSARNSSLTTKQANIDIPVVDKFQKIYFHTIEGLDYFTEYRLEIVACHEYPSSQNYSQEILDRLEGKLCSPEARTTIRTLPNVQVDSIPVIGDGRFFGIQTTKKGIQISWRIPSKVNGIVLFYRLRYKIDSHGAGWNDQCVDPEKSNVMLKKQLNSSETSNIMESTVLNLHRSGLYLFQIMVVSLAGNGTWSEVEKFDFQNHEEYTMRISIIVTTLLLVVIACSIIAGVTIWKKNQKYILTTNLDFIYSGHDDWDINIQDIKLVSPIGRGNFGMVYDGLLTKLDTPAKHTTVVAAFPLKVAVKTITQPATCDDMQDFLSEACLMKEFIGHHLVHLLGIYSGTISNDGGSLPLVVMEMMEKGDLRTYLHLIADEGEKGAIEGKRCLLWAIQIADGMCYLASKRFVHRDLAARNCLVDANLNLKIGDFGLARSTNENDYYRKKGRAKMPVRWMAPESLKSAFFSTKSDVWSYGVVLYEVATLGGLPYSGMSHEEVIEFVKDKGKLDHEDLKLPSALLDVMVWCWSFEDTVRPSFMRLLEYLVPYVADEEFARVSFFNKGFSALDRCVNCLNAPTTDAASAELAVPMETMCNHIYRCSCFDAVPKCEACRQSPDKCERDKLLTLSVRDILKQQDGD